jgi:hypothetical protein
LEEENGEVSCSDFDSDLYFLLWASDNKKETPAFHAGVYSINQ